MRNEVDQKVLKVFLIIGGNPITRQEESATIVKGNMEFWSQRYKNAKDELAVVVSDDASIFSDMNFGKAKGLAGYVQIAPNSNYYCAQKEIYGIISLPVCDLSLRNSFEEAVEEDDPDVGARFCLTM